jgi:hypothetical protein
MTISYLITVVLSSIYNTNMTAEEESSTKQSVLNAKTEPQILSGNWTFKMDQGIIKDFKAKFTMFNKTTGMFFQQHREL